MDHFHRSCYTINTGVPQGGIISPLLSNIALNGLEFHLMNFVSDLKLKPNPDSARGKKTKQKCEYIDT